MKFKSQTELVTEVQTLAKDTLKVFELLGLPSSRMSERWGVIAEASIEDLLGEQVKEVEKREETLVNYVYEIVSSAEDIGRECQRLNSTVEDLVNEVEKIKRLRNG